MPTALRPGALSLSHPVPAINSPFTLPSSYSFLALYLTSGKRLAGLRLLVMAVWPQRWVVEGTGANGLVLHVSRALTFNRDMPLCTVIARG